MLHARGLRLVWTFLLIAAPLAAQPAATLSTPPVRPLGSVVATSAVTFTRVSEVRALSDGRVLVHDITARTLILLDERLGNARTILDSAGGLPNSYGTRPGRLLPFVGDSSLFFDWASYAYLVLDPAGKVARVMPGWPTAPFIEPGGVAFMQERMAESMAGIASQSSMFSPALGFVTSPINGVSNTRFLPRMPDPVTLYRLDDTARVMSMRLDTRAIDTLGSHLVGVRRVSQQYPSSNINTEVFQPWDPWTVTTDGSIVILRAREYRIDWINPDRSRTSGERLPYPWARLSDADKARIVDSTNGARGIAAAAELAAWIQDSTNVAQGKPTVSGRPASMFRLRPAGAGTVRAVELADVSDFVPAVSGSAAELVADAENRIWIRPRAMNPTGAPSVYDVVDRAGRVVDRVRIPEGLTLTGFGPGGVVYLVSHDAGRMALVKARVR